jgi:hypothetical protein
VMPVIPVISSTVISVVTPGWRGNSSSNIGVWRGRGHGTLIERTRLMVWWPRIVVVTHRSVVLRWSCSYKKS